MLRRLLLVLLLGTTRVTPTPDNDLDDLINEIFGQDNSLQPIGEPRCESIDGELGAGCHECYNCEHEAVVGRPRRDIKRLTLNSELCDKMKEVCCVSQALVFNNRIGEACGVRRPDGVGARKYRKPNQVLTGEFPWIAAVYSSKQSNPQYVCGAVLISARYLLTTARCVIDTKADQLAIKIGANGDLSNKLEVEHVVTHENFDSGTGHSDIALLRLAVSTRSSLPAWAAPACLPTAAPLPAITCVTVTKTNHAVNSVVVRRKVCDEVLQQGKPVLRLDATQVCSAANTQAAPHTEHGAPLVCQDVSSSEWVVYGLASYRGALQGGLQLHTNVAHFKDWIKENTR